VTANAEIISIDLDRSALSAKSVKATFVSYGFFVPDSIATAHLLHECQVVEVSVALFHH